MPPFAFPLHERAGGKFGNSSAHRRAWSGTKKDLAQRGERGQERRDFV